MSNTLTTTSLSTNLNDFNSRQLEKLIGNKLNDMSIAIENISSDINRFNKDLINKTELKMSTDSCISLLKLFLSDLRSTQIEIETIQTTNIRIL